MYNLPELKDNGQFLEIQEVTTKKSGIYFLYNENKELMFIGETKNIRQGIVCKFNGTYGDIHFKHNYKYVKYILIDDPGDRRKYKVYYINKLKPKINKRDVETYKSERYDYYKSTEAEKIYHIKCQEEFDKTMDSFYL